MPSSFKCYVRAALNPMAKENSVDTFLNPVTSPVVDVSSPCTRLARNSKMMAGMLTRSVFILAMSHILECASVVCMSSVAVLRR